MAGDWKVDGGRLWASGVATAVVAGLVAATVLFVGRSLVGVEILVAPPGGALEPLSYTKAFGLAAIMALVATAVLHLLLVVVPRGTAYFGWLTTLFLILSFGPIFSLSTPLEPKLWLVAIHTLTYAVIVTLLLGAVPRVA